MGRPVTETALGLKSLQEGEKEVSSGFDSPFLQISWIHLLPSLLL